MGSRWTGTANDVFRVAGHGVLYVVDGGST